MKQWLLDFFDELIYVLKGTFYKFLYKRKGKCHKCGECCRHVYLRNEGQMLREFDQYLDLVVSEPKMKRFKPKGRDAEGYLYFSCQYISHDNLCLDYENRPDICRHYPSIHMLRYGAVPKDQCGYSFVSKFTEKEVSIK